MNGFRLSPEGDTDTPLNISPRGYDLLFWESGARLRVERVAVPSRAERYLLEGQSVKMASEKSRRPQGGEGLASGQPLAP